MSSSTFVLKRPGPGTVVADDSDASRSCALHARRVIDFTILEAIPAGAAHAGDGSGQPAEPRIRRKNPRLEIVG